jgi:outer membrane receptor protein involved in Fe transport
MRYLITSNFSLKASYYRTYQYIHLVSNTVSVTPQDFWIASSPSLEPERADQFSLGLFANYNKDKVELSVEGFYKNLDNVIDYIEGADNFLNQAMESGLIQGEGIAYGIEAMAKRNDGKLNGWVSYTYSRSLRKFNSDLQYKTINTGQYYPSVYDQPHNLSIVLNYKISPFVTLSSNFSYSTGRPITIPISKISYEHYLTVLSYSDRNEYRIPNYHRLDLSLTIKDKPKQNKIIRGEWVLGIYNVYGRKNAYSIFFKGKGDAYKMSILGTVFPSISYNFKL